MFLVPYRIWASAGALLLLLIAGFGVRSEKNLAEEVGILGAATGENSAVGGPPARENALAGGALPPVPAGERAVAGGALAPVPGRKNAIAAGSPAPMPARENATAAGPSVAVPAGNRSVIAVSVERRRLWLYQDGDVVFTAPIAVGTGDRLEYGGRTWRFETPRGRRVVRAKEAARVWVPPDWHYVELAQEHGFELSRLTRGSPVRLSGGRTLFVRGRSIVLEHADGRSEVLPRDEEVVLDRTLFIPPFGTLNRQIPGELGAFALDLGNGYLIHGTPDTTSIGRAASHGCIRLLDEDIRKLFEHVPIGTPVWID